MKIIFLYLHKIETEKHPPLYQYHRTGSTQDPNSA